MTLASFQMLGISWIFTPSPTAYTILVDTPKKDQWKNQVSSKVHQHVETIWKEDFASKSSLKYLNPNSVRVGRVHQIYAYVNNSTFDIRRAEMKSRLLTGKYTLQSNRARFNQFNVNPHCPLCNKQAETREHIIHLTNFPTEHFSKSHKMRMKKDINLKFLRWFCINPIMKV